MTDRETILVSVSVPFKEHLGKYASEHNETMSVVVRNAIAQYTGYSFGDADERPKKYATKEERLKAQRTKAVNERNSAAKILAAIMHEQHLEDAAALQAWLDRKLTDK